MLARSHRHVLGRCDICQRGLAGISVRNPYRNGKSIGGASEDDGDGAGEV